MNAFTYQQNQKKVIDQIESQVAQQSLSFTTVTPPSVSFQDDPRVSITSVHLPASSLINPILDQLIKPLEKEFPEHYYYDQESLHLTIKNVRVIHDPPLFDQQDIEVAQQVFAQVIPQHFAFNVYYYRLLLFPYNLALIGTTDPELDNIVLDLDQKLKEANVADDKKYINDRFFFSNVTLARFSRPVTSAFIGQVEKLSANLKFTPYCVDSVTLLTCNAVLKKRQEIETFWLPKNKE